MGPQDTGVRRKGGQLSKDVKKCLCSLRGWHENRVSSGQRKELGQVGGHPGYSQQPKKIRRGLAVHRRISECRSAPNIVSGGEWWSKTHKGIGLSMRMGLNFNQQDTASQWTLVTGMLGSVLPVTPLIDKDGDEESNCQPCCPQHRLSFLPAFYQLGWELVVGACF